MPFHLQFRARLPAKLLPWTLALANCYWACGPPTIPASPSPPDGPVERHAPQTAPDPPLAGAKPHPGPVRPATSMGIATPPRVQMTPSVCPEGMVEVEGEYCTEVRQHCEKSWYGKANKKIICEVFSEPSVCTGSRSPKHYCIDQYAWPNRRGARPEVMNTFYQAQVKCAAAGKRMCTESEWTLACEGPEMKPYPYGYVRDANKCNGDRPWDRPDMRKVGRRDAKELARLWQGVPSGSQPDCISDYGVYDLPGNNDEVVASENMSSGWRGRHDSVHTGGPWYRGVRNQCRPKIYSHDEGFYYYFLGFRCCSALAGKPTDPRTPKQKKKNQSFGYVERLAGFSMADMKGKFAEGMCSCSPKDRLCKTMCGTLLGTDAHDAEPRLKSSKK